MKGHIKERGHNRYAIVLDARDPQTGKRKRRWHSFRGTKREAQKECAKLISEIASGTYVEPSKQIFEAYFAAWLRDWAPMKAGPKCVETYGHLGRHLIAEIGTKPIAQIRSQPRLPAGGGPGVVNAHCAACPHARAASIPPRPQGR